MSEKKGDIFFRDFHGNFHKLDISEISNELSEITFFDSILSSSQLEKKICNDNKYYYHKLILKNIKNSEINSNRLSLDKGLFKLSVYLNINSSKSQKVYFFFRNKTILESSLQINSVYKEIPNNFNFNIIIKSEKNNNYEIAIISENELKSVDSYILYNKII